MTKHAKKLAVSIFVVAWLIISIIMFGIANRVSYIQIFFPNWPIFAQKLSQISFLSYLTNLFISFVGTGLFTITCTGLGLITLKRLKTPSVSDLAFTVTAFITGEILFSIFLLSVISKSILTPTITSTTMVIGFIASMPALWNFFQDIRSRDELSRTNSRQKPIPQWIVVILVLSLMLSSARLGYDAVSDYFSQAKLMAVSGEATSFFPGNYMIVSSLHLDILFTALIQLFGDEAARMFPWINGVAVLLMGYALAGEAGLSSRARAYYLILLMTSTAFTDLLGDGKVELISTAPIIAAMYWMALSAKLPSKGNFLLIGFLTGFAIISRLYNIFLVSLFTSLFIILWLIGERSNMIGDTTTKKLTKLAQFVFWMAPTLLLLGGFHLLQNWIWLDDPLAPLKFAPKLKAGNWQWQFNPALLNSFRLLYPLTSTFLNNPQSLGSISPLFIGFLPFLAIKDIRTKIQLSRYANFLLIAGICTLILWLIFFYTVVEIRYVFFIWMLLFLPASQLIEHSIDYTPEIITLLIQIMLTATFTYLSIRIIAISIETYSPIDVAGDAHCGDIDFCTFLDSVNHTAAPGDRVFVLNAYRYYLRNDLFVCSSRSNEYPALQVLAQKNSPDFWIEIYRQGFRFITYEKNFAVFHSRFGTIPDPRLAPSWLKISIISPATDKNNTAYRIDAVDPPIRPKISCKQYRAGIWQLTSSPTSQP